MIPLTAGSVEFVPVEWFRRLAVMAVVLVAPAAGCGVNDSRAGDTQPAPEPRLVADFDFEVELDSTNPTYCPIEAVQFTDRSRGGPTEWEWSFPEGRTSTERNPQLTAVSLSTFDVTLTVSNGDDEDSTTKEVAAAVC